MMLFSAEFIQNFLRVDPDGTTAGNVTRNEYFTTDNASFFDLSLKYQQWGTRDKHDIKDLTWNTNELKINNTYIVPPANDFFEYRFRYPYIDENGDEAELVTETATVTIKVIYGADTSIGITEYEYDFNAYLNANALTPPGGDGGAGPSRGISSLTQLNPLNNNDQGIDRPAAGSESTTMIHGSFLISDKIGITNWDGGTAKVVLYFESDVSLYIAEDPTIFNDGSELHPAALSMGFTTLVQGQGLDVPAYVGLTSDAIGVNVQSLDFIGNEIYNHVVAYGSEAQSGAWVSSTIKCYVYPSTSPVDELYEDGILSMQIERLEKTRAYLIELQYKGDDAHGSVFGTAVTPTVAGGRPDSRRDQWEGYTTDSTNPLLNNT